jgi:D-sedoheptulose 7-phosphate isomerase
MIRLSDPHRHLEDLVARYPVLKDSAQAVESAYFAVVDCYHRGGTVLACGNGGSSADADHIVGELMKGFLKKRPLPEDLQAALRTADAELGDVLARKLQAALPAIDLSAQSALATAFANDVDGSLSYAQQVLGYGRPGDVLIGISTSGNASNVLAAFVAAKARGVRTIGLTGASGGRMKDRSDLWIPVPASSTPEVQELHLPVYHCLCAMVEEHFYPK